MWLMANLVIRQLIRGLFRAIKAINSVNMAIMALLMVQEGYPIFTS